MAAASPPEPSSSTSVTPAVLQPAGTLRLSGFIAGGASGMTKLVVGHPFDTIKLRMQCSPAGTYSGPTEAFLKTVRLEGFRALYKGATPPALGWLISDPVLLGSLHNYRLMFARMEARRRGELEGDVATERLSLWGHTAAGAMAGWTVCFVITPIEQLKARLQMQMVGPKLYTGPIDCATQIVRTNGVLGLWHGFVATLLFRSWFGAMFCSYEVILRSFRAIPPDSPYRLSEGTATFLAGGLSSNVFWIGSFPFDSVKNRLMTDDLRKPKYRNWRGAARALWAEGRVKALYRGFVPCLLRAFPTNASAIFVWETTMRLMGAEQLVK